MENSITAKEIIGLEKKYWKAMADHDLDAALSLTDFPCLIAGPQGRSLVTEEEFKKMFESHRNEIRTFEFENNPEVRLLNPETAVTAYRAKSRIVRDGKEEDCDIVDTSTWIKRNGKWVCAMHTESEIRA